MNLFFKFLEPKKCGLCEVGQTIAELTEKIENVQQIAPRVVLMIGMNDLLKVKNCIPMKFFFDKMKENMMPYRIMVHIKIKEIVFP